MGGGAIGFLKNGFELKLPGKHWPWLICLLPRLTPDYLRAAPAYLCAALKKRLYSAQRKLELGLSFAICFYHVFTLTKVGKLINMYFDVKLSIDTFNLYVPE